MIRYFAKRIGMMLIALFMIIPRNKLEGKDKSLIEVINLKHDRDDIPNIVNSKTIFNAYHMNKKNLDYHPFRYEIRFRRNL